MKTAVDTHHIVELHRAGVPIEDIVKVDRTSLGIVKREVRLYEDGLSKDAIYGSIIKNIMRKNGLRARHCNVCDRDQDKDCQVQVMSGRNVPRIKDLSYICNRCLKELA